ncbi:MAG: SdrD B-like domain-containing protein, partial [Thermomicrobiales bacterium]
SVVRDTGISISSFVWYDTNNDGIRQDDEDGLAGVTVQVIEDIASQPVAGTAITRSDGSFTILGIKSTKTYFLRFLLPDPSLIFSPQDAGSDDSLDSDVNIATGETDPFTPQPDERISRFAAGAVGPDPVLTVNDVSITEGNQGSKLLTFTAQLTWAAPQRLTVDYATANSTAQGSLVFGFSSGRIIVIPRDFIAANGTLVFEKGESTRNINIEILGDTTWEDRSHEQFDLNFSNPSAGLALGTASATGYIIEDDSAPAISIGDYNNAAEPENGTATFTVSLSNPSDEDVTFTWATQVATKQDGTGLAVDAADPGIDFAIQNPTTATILAGQTEIELTVNLLGDLTDEVNEQFFVSIYNPSSNATIADDRGVGIIYD